MGFGVSPFLTDFNLGFRIVLASLEKGTLGTIDSARALAAETLKPDRAHNVECGVVLPSLRPDPGGD